MRFKSLGFKLLTMTVIVIVLFTGFTNHFIANYLLDVYDETIEERNDSYLNAVLCDFESEKNSIEAAVKSISIFVSSKFDQDGYLANGDMNMIEERLEALLRDYVSDVDRVSDSAYVYFNPFLDGNVHDVWLHNYEGNIVREDEIPMERYISKDNMDWFFGPMETRTSSWVPPYTNRYGKHVTSYVVPVFVGERFIGIVGMYLDITKVKTLLSGTTFFEGDIFWVYDENGSVVYHPSYKEGTNISTFYENKGERKTVVGDKSYYTSEKQTNAGWTFAYSIPSDVHSKSRRMVTIVVISAFFVCLAVLITIVYLIFKKYSRIFRKIMAGLREFDKGNLKHSIQHNQKNELGIMIDAINSSNKKQYQIQERLYQIAHYHSVTNLPNRNSFSEDIDRMFDQSNHLAMCYVNIDQFRVINDLIGYSKGDEFIKLIAQKFIEQTNGLKLYHLSIDEFIIISDSRNCLDELTEIAQNILNDFGRNIEFLGHNFFVTVSIGIVSKNIELMKLEDFLRASDLAMIQARENGRNNFRVYDREMYDQLIGLTNLERDFSLGLNNDEFEVYYQPKVTLWNNKVESLEALVRWNHPTKGIVKPDGFIDFAEKSGLIVNLGFAVIKKVCSDLRKWQEEGREQLSIAINLSIRQIMDDSFVESLIEIIEENDITPGVIEFEITESLFIQDEQAVKNRMNIMNAYGIRFSLDDFGSGYSSLHVLNELKVDTLKIDKSLIQQCVTSDNAHLMVETITHMAHKLGLEVVAEGVESKYELDVIEDIGIDIVQGFYFSRAVPASEIYHTIKLISKEEKGSN